MVAVATKYKKQQQQHISSCNKKKNSSYNSNSSSRSSLSRCETALTQALARAKSNIVPFSFDICLDFFPLFFNNFNVIYFVCFLPVAKPPGPKTVRVVVVDGGKQFDSCLSTVQYFRFINSLWGGVRDPQCNSSNFLLFDFGSMNSFPGGIQHS